MMNSDVANFLWVGNQLSMYEFKCIESFVENGFIVHVYSYGHLDLPNGALLKDGREILPESEVYSYTQAGKQGNLAAFSDAFRFQLCKLRAGWWFDTDVFCLKNVKEWQALAESREGFFVFGWESEELVNGAVMYSDNKNFDETVQEHLKKIGKNFIWGEIGPRLITKVVNQIGLINKVVPKDYFYPINFNDMQYFFDPKLKTESIRLIQNSFCVHLWNEIYSIYKIPKNIPPPIDSFLNELLSRHSSLDNKYAISKNVIDVLFDYPAVNELRGFKQRIESKLIFKLLKKIKNLF